MFKRSDDQFVKEKKNKKARKVETELSEAFLPEGGGLDAGQLEKLNAARSAVGGSMRKSLKTFENIRKMMKTRQKMRRSAEFLESL